MTDSRLRSASQWLLAMALLCCCPLSSAQTDGNDDPATAEIPNLQSFLNDARRAIVLEVSFGPGETASIESMGVSETPPGSMDDDPLFLALVTFDAQGLPLYDQNGWDPRWHLQKTDSGEEEAVFLEESVGSFRIPFDHKIRSLAIFNLRGQPGVPLLETDITSVVASFCDANPNNVNCDGFVLLPLFADGFE